MTTGGASSCPDLLKDVVAYVDVWSSDKTDNYSKSFIQQLQEMGAEVTKSFSKKVTHVVFKNGHHATWTKAKRTGVKLVSVLWVARCKDDGEHVDEELYPALNDDVKTVLNKKKHRCMQPGEEKTPDKRKKKKLDKMIKDLIPKPPFVPEDVSPYIIDQENKIVYSPSWKRSESMAQRLREMKAQRENLSPTASQMVESSTSSGLKPSIGSTPSFLKSLDEESDEESSASAAQLAHSSERDRSEEKKLHGDDDHCDHNPLLGKDSEKPWLTPYSDVKKQKDLQKPWLSPCSDVPKQTRRTSTKSDPLKKKIFCYPKSPCPDVSEGSKWGGRTRQSRLSFSSSVPEKNKTMQSDTHPEGLSSLSCTSVPSIAGNAVVNQEQSKGIVSQPSKVDHQTANKPRHSFSLLCSYTKAKTNTSITSSSVDQDEDVFEDDHMFEDYFSVPSHRHTPHTILLGPNKKKRRYSETAVPEKKKADESTKKSCHKDVIQKHPHQDVQVDSHSTNVDSVTGNARTLPFMSRGEFTAQSVKRRRTLSTQPNKECTAGVSFCQQKKSDVKVCSQSREFVGGGTEHAVAAACTDSISENIQKTRVNLSIEGDKQNKTMRTLVMTSLSTDQQSTVTQVVRTLGRFTIVDQVCESTTHVVSGHPRRTLKVLLGIARGCWILSFEWILWCLEKRQWIPEEPYELKDSFPAATICRLQQHLSAGEHQQDLLQDQPIMFVSAHAQPPADSLVELIELCGGTVSKTIRKAGICIGEFDRKRPEGCRILSEQWLLDSITHLKLLPYDDYDLERRSP